MAHSLQRELLAQSVPADGPVSVAGDLELSKARQPLRKVLKPSAPSTDGELGGQFVRCVLNDVGWIANDVRHVANCARCIAHDRRCVLNDVRCVAKNLRCVLNDLRYIAHAVVCNTWYEMRVD